MSEMNALVRTLAATEPPRQAAEVPGAPPFTLNARRSAGSGRATLLAMAVVLLMATSSLPSVSQALHAAQGPAPISFAADRPAPALPASSPPAAPATASVGGACSPGNATGVPSSPSPDLGRRPGATTGPSPLFNSQVVPYASLTGPYAYVAAGAALRDQGYGLINLTWPGGSTANLVAAYLIWSIINDTVPPSSGTLNGGNVAGTWTAYATPSPCWGITYIYTFAAEVTNLVTNGVNNLTNFATGVTNGGNPWSITQTAPLADSASLIAIYDNSSSTSLHQVTVYSGASPIGSPAPTSETATLTYSAANSSLAKTTFIVADGQLPHNYAEWNGTTIDSNAFPGDDPHESTAAWSYGNLSDTRTYNVNVSVGSNQSTAVVGSPPSTDCLTWVGQVLSVGVAATKGPYPVVFEEQGLPNGTSWNVTTNGVTTSGTVANATSSIAFTLANGSYTYAAGAVPGYFGSTGLAYQVRGGSVFIRVIFHQVLYYVEFNDSGLPYLKGWWVDFTNASQGLADNTTAYAPAAISYSGGNGTYNFTAGDAGLYVAQPTRSSVVVRGNGVVVNITFVPPPLFAVTVREQGLKSGTSWGANVDSNWGYFSNLTSSSSFTLMLPNTTGYADTLYPSYVTGYSSIGYLQFTVAGAPETLDVNYSKLYTASLVETGLPASTDWYGYLYNSSTGNNFEYTVTPYLNFSVPNGTYAFTVETVWGYTATPMTGNITVTGANASRSIVFTPSPRYTIAFNETGLATGANWTVTLGLPNGSEIVTELDGALDHVRGAQRNVQLLSHRGRLLGLPLRGVLRGQRRQRVVPDQLHPALLHHLHGVGPAERYGTWYVYFGYTYLGAYSSTIVFWTANGTFSWYTYSTGSYSPSPASGSITISGANSAQAINYTSPTAPTYAVQFLESGLGPHTNWSIDLNGYTESTRGATLNFTEANGTLGFTVGAPAGTRRARATARSPFRVGPPPRRSTSRPPPRRTPSRSPKPVLGTERPGSSTSPAKPA